MTFGQFICKDIWTVIFKFLQKAVCDNRGRPMIDDYYKQYAFVNTITVELYFGQSFTEFLRSAPKSWRRLSVEAHKKFCYGSQHRIPEINVGLEIEHLRTLLFIRNKNKMREICRNHGHYQTELRLYKQNTGKDIDLSDRQLTIIVHFFHKINLSYLVNNRSFSNKNVMNSQRIIDKYPETLALNYLVLQCDDFPVVPYARIKDLDTTTKTIIERRFGWTEQENNSRYFTLSRNDCRQVVVIFLLSVFWPPLIIPAIIFLPIVIACFISRSPGIIGIGIAVNFMILFSLAMILMILGLTQKI